MNHVILFAGVGADTKALQKTENLLSKSNFVPEKHPDCMIFAPGASIETIREELRPWAYRYPMLGENKVAIILSVDQLSPGAANSLLKLLEEPPEYLSILLTTSLIHDVLPTIRSRCQIEDFSGQPAKEPTDKDAINLLLEAINGNISDKLAVAKKVSAQDDPEITAKAWLLWVRDELPKNATLATKAHGLLELISVLHEPQFNHRLALERFLLSS